MGEDRSGQKACTVEGKGSVAVVTKRRGRGVIDRSVVVRVPAEEGGVFWRGPLPPTYNGASPLRVRTAPKLSIVVGRPPSMDRLTIWSKVTSSTVWNWPSLMVSVLRKQIKDKTRKNSFNPLVTEKQRSKAQGGPRTYKWHVLVGCQDHS